MKAKGLEKRHYTQMGLDLGVEINLHKLNLNQLAALNIHKGSALDKIKQIADHASKEHAIKLTLDQVESDVYNTEVFLLAYKDTKSYVIRCIDEDL